MKHKNNKVVDSVIYVFAVFMGVCMRFRPLRYYSPCQVYTTLRTIITSNCWLASVHLTNIFRKLICRVHWPYNQHVFDRSILNKKIQCSAFVGSAWSFVFFIPTTTTNDLRLRGIFYIRSYPLHYFLILILEKEPVFLMFSAKQGNYWYHSYNVFGMTRSLTGDWTRDLPHSKPAIYH